MNLLAANNAGSVVAVAVAIADTEITLAGGTGLLFPDPVPDESYFVMTFTDRTQILYREVVWVLEKVGDVFTILRAQEGTEALAWPVGSFAMNLVTAGQMNLVSQPLNSRRVLGGGTINMLEAAGEIVILANGGATSVFLFEDAPAGFKQRVSDGSGNFETNNCSVEAAAAGTINGATGALPMTFNWETTLFRSLGNNNWSIL